MLINKKRCFRRPQIQCNYVKIPLWTKQQTICFRGTSTTVL